MKGKGAFFFFFLYFFGAVETKATDKRKTCLAGDQI